MRRATPEASTVSFTVSRTDAKLIQDIAQRAVGLAREAKADTSIQLIAMDVTACHANGCPLRLLALLNADNFNFAHDVFGIGRHLNRTTGELEDCFVPRFAQANGR